MFNVINLETSEPERNEDGAAIVCATGAEAAALAKSLAAANGKRYQPRPVLDTAWRDREAWRLLGGTYTRLPWDQNASRYYRDLPQADKWHWMDVPNEATAHHYAHVSTKVPGNIAFTENDDKGSRDIQTSMKPGRYLARFYPELGQETIKTLANEFIAIHGQISLHWATTADEIEHVYTNGPRSCMSHPANDYASHMHPVRVYAAGDLSVAYLKASDGDSEAISGRVLVWKDKKVYSRVYGDEDKLHKLLEAEGYRYGILDGARMLRVEDRRNDGCFIVPYVDQSYRADDRGDYLIIDSRGAVDCEQTNGLSGASGTPCECCGDHFGEDNLHYYEDAGGYLCDSCESENTFYCEYNLQSYYGHEYVLMANGETWCQDAFDRHGFECEGNGQYYHEDDCVTLHDGTRWSQGYFGDHGFVCSGSGDGYATSDMVRGLDGDNYSQEYVDDHPEVVKEPEDEDTDEPEDTNDTSDHVARQGRDETDNQLELTLEAL